MVNSIINRKERFATEGLRFQRHNGDGTIPTLLRFLGFANTVNLSNVVDNSGIAELTIKVDDLPKQTLDVDFSEITDLTRVTVQEAITALTAAHFTGVTWSVDQKTKRLKGSMAGEGKIIQVVGRLAAALDFGNCVKHGGNGLEVVSFFDDETVSVGLPKDIKDKEEIDSESAKGKITRMIIGAMIQGISPVFTTKVKDYYFLELVQGGNLDRETGIYNPPVVNEQPSFWVEMFSPVYSEGSNKMSDVAGYERLFLRSVMGMEGDVPAEAKQWAQYAYNLTATKYTDENDIQFSAWEEGTISTTQFDALNVKKIKVE